MKAPCFCNQRGLCDVRRCFHVSTVLQGLIAKMGKAGAAEVLRSHRETHMTKANLHGSRHSVRYAIWLGFLPSSVSHQADFQRMRSCGLNAVRLPFGYWVVTEPRRGECGRKTSEPLREFECEAQEALCRSGVGVHRPGGLLGRGVADFES